MQELMSNIRRHVEILRKYQKEMLKIKIIVTELNNAFDGFISRLQRANNTLPHNSWFKDELSREI